MKKIFLLIICGLCLTACVTNVSKEAKNVSDFEASAVANGFEVVKNNVDYEGVPYISEYSKVTYGESEVQMIVYSDSEMADEVQQSHIESFMVYKSTGAPVNKESGKNYYHYSLISNNMYMLSARVENTLIFCKINVKDKALVENIINELGY